MWGSNPLLVSEKLQVSNSIPTMGHHAQGGVSGEILSQPLLPASIWAFSPLPRASFLFFFFPDEVILYVAGASVALKRS